MPVKGAKVRRGDWFRAVEARVARTGFCPTGYPTDSGAPQFSRSNFLRCEYVVQIAMASGFEYSDQRAQTEHHVPQLHDAILILDALDLTIEFPD